MPPHLNIHLGEQSLALDLDEFSAPFFGAFWLYLLSLLSKLADLESSGTVFLHFTQSKISGLQLKSLPADFSF